MALSNLLLLLLLLLFTLTTSSSAAFNCSTTSTCHSLIDFTPTNATTLSAIKSLFNISHLRTLLAANNLPLSTLPSYLVTSTSTILIPFSCLCRNSSGLSNGRPIYTVQPNDGLYKIASFFSHLVTYQEIAAANNIPDPDKINVGQQLWIPLPCSCDKVDGEEVVHYGHVVEAGSSVERIAEEYGTTQETLLRINGISDPAKLLAGQVLDVPLKACATSVSNASLDYPLLVSNNTYVFTANNCVKCQCSSANNWTLQCEPSNLNSTLWTTCPSMQCPDSNQLYIGNTTSSTCNKTTCSYTGYTAKTILTNLVAESTCSTCATSVSNASLDYPLLVSNNTYVFTANNCVKCQCSSANNWTLQCEPSNLNSTLWTTCPSMQCPDSNQLYIGNTTSSTCNKTTCSYTGYTAKTILTNLVAESTCSTPNTASKMGSHGFSWNMFLAAVHVLLLCVYLP